MPRAKKRIETSRQCLAALRKLGYRKTAMQMTRVANTYGMDGDYGGRLTITVAKHSDQFIIMDRAKTPNDWGMMSALLTISNTKVKAEHAMYETIECCVALGVLERDQPVNQFELVIAFATAAAKEEEEKKKAA